MIATGINTDGKITNANKTILKMFVRRKRTKKMTMFRPLELDEDQVAADSSSSSSHSGSGCVYRVMQIDMQHAGGRPALAGRGLSSGRRESNTSRARSLVDDVWMNGSPVTVSREITFPHVRHAASGQPVTAQMSTRGANLGLIQVAATQSTQGRQNDVMLQL
jgi:hypothetical protein